MRHTKILATVGPASETSSAIDALIAAGVDAFRLNFSHGTHDWHRETCARIRVAAARAGRTVAVLQDLSGPKIRTGRLDGGRPIALVDGATLRIVTGGALGGPGIVSTEFEGLARAVRPGDRLLLADGAIELRVDGSDGVEIRATVIEGGELGEHKGINAPGVSLAASALTPKDVADLAFGLSIGVDMVAVSFVQSAGDILATRRAMSERGGNLPIVAKLERPQALDDLDAILEAADAVMVARGDLGLEMPLEKVPTAQKAITMQARRRQVPVIVATQVLESMTHGARPTRAEVSDAANAVADGVDAIMLAGETAVGVSPARAVRTLDAIVREAESTSRPAPVPPGPQDAAHEHGQALCEAAVTLADRGGAQAIVAVTREGATARRLAAMRPRVPIMATTDREEMARRLALLRGVTPLCTDIGENVDEAGTLIVRQLVGRGLVTEGLPLVLVSISDDLTRSDANYLRIQRA
jgi:pyruvate kinase